MAFSAVYAASSYGFICYGKRGVANYSASFAEALTSSDLLANIVRYSNLFSELLTGADTIAANLNYAASVYEIILAFDSIFAKVLNYKNIFTSDENRQAVVVYEKRAGESDFARSGMTKSDARSGATGDNRVGSVKDNRVFK